MSPPNNPHDCALWLFDQLEAITGAGDHWEGVVPKDCDFDAVAQAIPQAVLISSDARSRRIEFAPKAGHVFQSMQELLEGPWRRRVPATFTVRDLAYTHGRTALQPVPIQNYLDAVDLWAKLTGFAEYAKDNGTELLFIQSFDSKVWLTPDYGPDDLATLADWRSFAAQYFDDQHHRDQKRNIVRAALLEIFTDRVRAKLAELLRVYPDFVERVRSSYALYTNDFSFERLKSDVAKQNQEDTLRINKTFSDIQNQLLGLPAALLAAGAGTKPGAWVANLTILLGVGLFAWFMRQLILNQCSSVDAIGAEINLRKKKVEEQPAEISKDVLALFDALTARVERQKRVLQQVSRGIWLVVVVAILLTAHAQGCLSAMVELIANFVHSS